MQRGGAGGELIVSDAQEDIFTAFTDENRNHQLNLVHVGRTLECNLWNDCVFSLDQHNEVVSEVINEAFHLKNSVAKHRPDDRAYEEDSVTVGSVRVREGCGVSSVGPPSIVTFAEQAVEGFEVPGISTPVERLMGEVSKRCKNQWMRWTTEGLEAILQFGW